MSHTEATSDPTPLSMLHTTVRIQAQQIERLESQLAQEIAGHQLWKFRATENGKTIKKYKQAAEDLFNQMNNNTPCHVGGKS